MEDMFIYNHPIVTDVNLKVHSKIFKVILESIRS